MTHTSINFRNESVLSTFCPRWSFGRIIGTGPTIIRNAPQLEELCRISQLVILLPLTIVSFAVLRSIFRVSLTLSILKKWYLSGNTRHENDSVHDTIWMIGTDNTRTPIWWYKFLILNNNWWIKDVQQNLENHPCQSALPCMNGGHGRIHSRMEHCFLFSEVFSMFLLYSLVLQASPSPLNPS